MASAWFGTEVDSRIVAAAGVSILVACFVSFRHIHSHLTHYYQPEQQRNVVRILAMVPIYSMTSFLSLLFEDFSIYLDGIRSCYEAFVLYTFLCLCYDFLGGEHLLAERLSGEEARKHAAPLCMLPPFRPDWRFLVECKQYVLQYIYVRPATAFLSVCFFVMNLYTPGNMDFDSGYPYIAIINTLSVSISLYALFEFYLVVRKYLQRRNPLIKFACIKGIVFLTYWQSVFLSILVKIGLIRDSPTRLAIYQASSLQNFMICMEMTFFAIGHVYAYPYVEHMNERLATEETMETTGLMTSVRHASSMNDFLEDTERVFFHAQDPMRPYNAIEDEDM